MRILVIGGTGHIGSYLLPTLAEAGHEVISMSRGRREPYRAASAWGLVKKVIVNRVEEEESGRFAGRVRDLGADVVVDLVCFKLSSAKVLVEALRGQVRHFLHCGTLWVHGPTEIAPTTEDRPRRPVGEYGTQKAAIEELLLTEAQRSGFPATVLHPGHIVGPGWPPINPAGNLNPAVFEKLARGEELALPDQGLGMLHHVHAADVAQAFLKSMARWNTSVGEAFHVVSPAALTLRGYAQAVASWFGREAVLKFVPWDEWKKSVSEKDAQATWDHISRSPCASIDKARRMLEYQPRYTSLEAIREAVAWLIHHKKISAPWIE